MFLFELIPNSAALLPYVAAEFHGVTLYDLSDCFQTKIFECLLFFFTDDKCISNINIFMFLPNKTYTRVQIKHIEECFL